MRAQRSAGAGAPPTAEGDGVDPGAEPAPPARPAPAVHTPIPEAAVPPPDPIAPPALHPPPSASPPPPLPAPAPAQSSPELEPEPKREPAPDPLAGAGVAAVTGPPRVRRRRRSPRARLLAVLALLVVIGAIVLVLSSREGPKPVKAPPAPAVVRVLVPEGETRAQIALIAAHDGIRGDYRVASRSSPLLNPATYGAPARTPDLEGFLFPATYDEYPGAPATRLVSDQLTAFREEVPASVLARAKGLGITPYQLIIVASMVEREALIPGDRAKIAAVIYNRLHAGMPLGIDATIYYAVELRENVATYTHELTEEQLHIDSPYNTRIHVGLPPTPISNPGLASLEAAARPAHVSYLYYVAGADGCGEQVFSNTAAAFEADVAAYKQAVARNHGHAPVCKKK